jgi:hypothetical protein
LAVDDGADDASAEALHVLECVVARSVIIAAHTADGHRTSGAYDTSESDGGKMAAMLDYAATVGLTTQYAVDQLARLEAVVAQIAHMWPLLPQPSQPDTRHPVRAPGLIVGCPPQEDRADDVSARVPARFACAVHAALRASRATIDHAGAAAAAGDASPHATVPGASPAAIVAAFARFGARAVGTEREAAIHGAQDDRWYQMSAVTATFGAVSSIHTAARTALLLPSAPTAAGSAATESTTQNDAPAAGGADHQSALRSRRAELESAAAVLLLTCGGAGVADRSGVGRQAVGVYDPACLTTLADALVTEDDGDSGGEAPSGRGDTEQPTLALENFLAAAAAVEATAACEGERHRQNSAAGDGVLGASAVPLVAQVVANLRRPSSVFSSQPENGNNKAVDQMAQRLLSRGILSLADADLTRTLDLVRTEVVGHCFASGNQGVLLLQNVTLRAVLRWSFAEALHAAAVDLVWRRTADAAARLNGAYDGPPAPRGAARRDQSSTTPQHGSSPPAMPIADNDIAALIARVRNGDNDTTMNHQATGRGSKKLVTLPWNPRDRAALHAAVAAWAAFGRRRDAALERLLPGPSTHADFLGALVALRAELQQRGCLPSSASPAPPPSAGNSATETEPDDALQHVAAIHATYAALFPSAADVVLGATFAHGATGGIKEVIKDTVFGGGAVGDHSSEGASSDVRMLLLPQLVIQRWKRVWRAV